jgi:hypothetical protein
MNNYSLLEQTPAWAIALVLFIMMILSIRIGIRTGRRKKKRLEESGKLSTLSDLPMTNLLFFLLAFTFGMSGTRYENRRNIVIDEANCIGTALLRADLYPAQDRTAFRNDFKEYIESRINYFHAGIDGNKKQASEKVTQVISARLWARASKLAFEPANTDATRQMIPALNAMFDITTTRSASERNKVPESILWMLIFMACISAFYSGYSATMKGHVDLLVEIGFCFLISLTVLFTLDLDRPHRGLVTLDKSNEKIIELRNNFR